MQRGVAGIAIGIFLTAAGTFASPRVFGPDERSLDHATVIAEAGSFWVRDGVNLPVLLTSGAEGRLDLPNLPVARLLLLDAATGRPVTKGRLRWEISEIPDTISTVAWSARGGRLDLGCLGGETVELTAPGYRPSTIEVQPNDRRQTVLLEPHGDLEIAVSPPAAGRLWIAAQEKISTISPFHSVATRHEIAVDGSATLRDLDANTEYAGVVVVPGKAPVVGHIRNLPKRLELPLHSGLTISGRVVGHDGKALVGARIETVGAIEVLGGFRYRQEGRTNTEGRFAITGHLGGTITVEACARGHACAEAVATLADDGASAGAINFELLPGHDFHLVVRDESGRAASGVTVIETAAFCTHETDDDGVLVFEGLEPGADLELEIFGAGLRPWKGFVRTDQSEVVLHIPAGGVLEWPILTDRTPALDDVTATWSRLDRRGREIAEGAAVWDPLLHGVRADGLDTGFHRLEVRLQGSATLFSEVVEVGPGEEIQLAAAVPERGLAILGRVLDGETSQPVAGARVSCEPGSANQFRKPRRLERLQTTITDADGIFLLEGLDPGRCRAMVRAPGFADWRHPEVSPDEAGTDLGDIELNHGMIVVGRVLDRSDRPQAGVPVEITEDAAYAYFAQTTVRTDHDGWFRAEALPVGSWVLSARRGEETASATVEGRAGESKRADLRLGGLRLEGEIWIGDRRASGGHLVLSTDGARGDGIVVMVQTDVDRRRFFGIDRPPVNISVSADGRFAADGIDAGVFVASYTPPGNGGAPVSQELIIPQTEHHRCLIQFSDAGLEGLVLDPDGLPVAGAAVFIQTREGRVLANSFSDGDGGFVFVGLDPGPVRVAAIHGEFGDADPMDVELRSGAALGPLTLELRPADGAELSLTVRSATGSLSGAPVYLVGAATMTAFTDGGGAAGFIGIEPGRHRPCAAAFGGSAGCGPEVELDDGDRRDVVLDLGQGGSIEVLLGPMERMPMLRVLTDDGIDLTSMLMMVNPPIPGLEGVKIGPLKADDYRIIVAMPEGSRQGNVSTVEGESAVLDLR